MRIIIPPIKSQGIKTKLVPWINEVITYSGVDASAKWIEPFFGTGVVGFNAPLAGAHIVGDTNPHVIEFYQGVCDGSITPYKVRKYLESQNELLSRSDENGYAYYREVKDRFNTLHNPLDFLFLSRAGFNGMMRFNRNGDWNIPFCKKPSRFSPAYITKICNQVDRVAHVLEMCDWRFLNVSFAETISYAGKDDLIYCDPPYYGRYVDYYNGWTERDEEKLYEALSTTPARFILSTWHHNDYRRNEMIGRFWDRFNILTTNHFYHSGAHIENRHSVVEALVFNFDIKKEPSILQQQGEPEFQFACL